MKNLLFAFTVGLLLVSACKKPVYPNCDSDSQCKVGPNGEALSGVCVQGKCEECAVNSDCQSGMQCVNNMCLSPCSGDTDCGAGKHCEGGFCRKDCDSMNACGAGMDCVDGRCVSGKGDRGCTTSGTTHFDFDRFDVKADDEALLNDIGMCMKKEADLNIVVEGHCDDRGSTEYNITLGNRRADAVRKYFGNLGISSDRIKTISYGEEKPVDPEQNEAAWAKNRRAEIKPQ